MFDVRQADESGRTVSLVAEEIVAGVARHVAVDGPVLILAPRNVVAQTIKEATAFYGEGLDVQDLTARRDLDRWLAAPAGVAVPNTDKLAGGELPLRRLAAGADVTLQRTWVGVDRHFERRLNRHEAPRLCPRCVAAGATAGRGLLLAGTGKPTGIETGAA